MPHPWHKHTEKQTQCSANSVGYIAPLEIICCVATPLRLSTQCSAAMDFRFDRSCQLFEFSHSYFSIFNFGFYLLIYLFVYSQLTWTNFHQFEISIALKCWHFIWLVLRIQITKIPRIKEVWLLTVYDGNWISSLEWTFRNGLTEKKKLKEGFFINSYEPTSRGRSVPWSINQILFWICPTFLN